MVIMFNSYIRSCGSYLPEKIVTNDDLAKKVDTSDDWITKRTGIKKRHIANEDQLTSHLAINAAKNALKDIDVSQIDGVILATTTPDLTFPATATKVASYLGIKGFAFDVQAVCSGFVYALNIANNFIKVGQNKNILVIGAETLSKIVNWQDRNTCVLFGDGAGAVVLSATENSDKGILSTSLYADGNLNNILNTDGGVGKNQQAGFIHMEGKEVFRHAVDKMADCVVKSLDKINLKSADIDLLIPHQANERILASVGKKLGLSSDKVISVVKDHANTSAASIPLALDYALKNNRVKENDIVVLEALGGGLTWGSIVIKWFN